MNGVAITTSSEVEKFAQTSSGMRKKLIPGARIVMIVTRKLSAVAIEDAPALKLTGEPVHGGDRQTRTTGQLAQREERMLDVERADDS